MAESENVYLKKRLALVEKIENEFPAVGHIFNRWKLSPEVRNAMATVPRHEFVDVQDRDAAYIDHAMSIGHGQTISQPFIVALMTELLNVGSADTVLEIGTGCGYQAAVLAEIVHRVYSIEVVESLADQAKTRLQELGYYNIQILHDSGRKGWPAHAPYDGVIVTAAAKSIPPALIEQLRPGGRLVIPVGQQWEVQDLQVIEKSESGEIQTQSIIPVAFVPLVK